MVMHFGVQRCAARLELSPHDGLQASLYHARTPVMTMTTPQSQIPTIVAAGIAQRAQAEFCNNTVRE